MNVTHALSKNFLVQTDLHFFGKLWILKILFFTILAKELHSPDGDSTTAPPSQSSEQSEIKINSINKVEFQLNPLQINSDCPQDPNVKKIKKVKYGLFITV